MSRKLVATTGLFSLFFCYQNANAQIHYDLKDYKSPEIHYQSLNLGTSLSGGFSQNVNSDYNNLSSQSNGSLAGQYSNYNNTHRYVGRTDLYGSFQYSFAGSKSKNASTGGNEFDGNSFNQDYRLGGTSINRFYLKKRDGIFLGAYGVASTVRSFSHQFSNELSWPYAKTEGRNKQYIDNYQLYLSVGSGRIEPVTYARMAYDTYNSLLNQNRLKTAPSNAQINSLADVMTKVGNTRFFDSRLKRIYQLEQIDSTLQASGLVKNVDMVYFANVNDIWGFANDFERGSGHQWEAGVLGDYSYRSQLNKLWKDDTLSTNDLYIMDNQGSIYGFAGYSNQKPVSVKWQRDINVSVYAGAGRYFSKIESQDNSLETRFRSTLRASYELGWYPNTRTYWRNGLYASSAAGQGVNPESDVINWGVGAGCYSRLYYYFSPRLRLDATLEIFYNSNFTAIGIDPMIYNASFVDTGFFNGNRWYITGHIGLSYALF